MTQQHPHAHLHAILAKGSKTFALATRLLPRAIADDTAAIYAWCRRADDAVDLAPSDEEARAALQRLEDELGSIEAGEEPADPVVGAFAEVVRRRGIPTVYPRELLLGMRMDVEGATYETLADLLVYCYRAAGTVGLMMCHVFGLTSDRGLIHAAHLGMAMQLTNICRDVEEDWQRGRLYLPRRMLGVSPKPSQTLDASALAPTVRFLDQTAAAYYQSGTRGLALLPWPAAMAVRAAALLYAEIGVVIARRDYDVRRGRAVVSLGRKLWLVARAIAASMVELPSRLLHRAESKRPLHTVRLDDVRLA